MEYDGLLRELCKLDQETEWVEFKCNNKNPEQIGEYISAIANSSALCGKSNGYLVWGVQDKTHEICGTDFKLKEARKGGQELESWLVQLLNPKIHFKFIEFEYDGNAISMIEIPRSSHTPVQFKGQEYIRVGSYKKKLKDYPEKERELWHIFDKTPFEEQITMERLEETDVLHLLDYPSYFELLDMPLPENRSSIIKCLCDDKMIRRRDDGYLDIYNLGAILFAKKLESFPHLSRKALRLIEYKGQDRIETQRELPGQKGYAVGFNGLIGFLKAMLPENEVIADALRKTVPIYPEVAIRELVANAIIHQDFTVTGAGPMVEVFEDRMEITSPGLPLVEVNRFLDTPPRSRNESLASFMRRIGICEERGSGIDKVVFETEFYQLPAPLFEVVEGQTRSILFAHKDFENMAREDKVRACYMHACLQWVKRSNMTNTSLRGRFGIDSNNSAKVSRIIANTLKENLIRNISESKKWSKYVPYWA